MMKLMLNKAFLYFKDQDIEKQGKESFHKKVERIQNLLSRLKIVANKADSETEEESKEEINVSDILKQIEAMETQASKIINPQLTDISKEKSEGVKPLTKLLENISKPEGTENQDVVYELMYNSDCKNLMVAAKISELKKRVNVIQKCLSEWQSSKNPYKDKSISHLLAFTQEEIKFMNEKEAQEINHKMKKFWSMLESTDGLSSDDFSYNDDVVGELGDIVAGDKEESDKVEQDIQKLESLKHVHEQSAEVFNKIKSLQESQKNIIASLSEDEKALGYIKESFGENLEIIKENMKNIQERIAKLKN